MKKLNSKEKALMSILWESDKPLRRQEILDRLDFSYSYTYHMLRVLEKNGLIRRVDGEYVHNARFEPTCTKEEYIAEIIKEFNPDMLKVVDLLK